MRSIAFATPRVGDGEAANDWAHSIAAADAGAIYMGAGQAAAIAAALLDAGVPSSLPVAVVENASLPDVRTVYTTLAALRERATPAIPGPALIFVGPQFRARSVAATREAGVPAAVLPARRRG